jgi:hypothetical protein
MVSKSDVTGIRALLCHMFPYFKEQADFSPDKDAEPVFGAAARL